ncbi:MAG: hypothetical protein JWP16_57 [Alphaproteobacteria bacterium]|nr:hypothetical protein [Alphaproteobacteria bacterium]
MVNPQKLSESVMAAPQQKPGFPASQPPATPLSAAESARYTLDMLENLRKIATRQGQTVLAHLLELAQAEARMLIRDAPAPSGAER